MGFFFGEGALGFLFLAFWVWAIFDVIATEESLVRNLPKGVWLIMVIFLSDIGAVAWLLLGRPQNAGWRPGDTSPRPVRRITGPEDSPRWDPRLDTRVANQETARERDDRLRRERYAELDAELDRRLEEKQREERRLEEWEADLRRREAELRSRDDPDSSGPAA